MSQKELVRDKKREPRLRFRDFTDEWQTKKIRDIFELTRGYVLAAPKTRQQKDRYYQYPVYSSQTKSEGLMGYYDEYLYENSITWTTDGANAGEVKYRTGKFYCTNVCGVLSSDKGYANQAIAAMLNRITHKYVSYVGNPKLMNTTMANISIVIPSVAEQQKIASFLAAVDARITKQQQKLSLLKDYKKGVMQKLFSQQIRFKDENGDEYPEWKERRLKDISNRITKKNSGNSVKFVLTNSATEGIVSQLDYFDKDIANQDNLLGYYVVSIGDFVYNPRVSVHAPVGPIKPNRLQLGLISPLYSVFRLNGVCERFYEQYFNTSYWHNYLKSVANSGARHDRMNITTADFYDMPLPYPCDDEQQKIADFLSIIDDKIESEKSQLANAKKFKTALLQKMFV